MTEQLDGGLPGGVETPPPAAQALDWSQAPVHTAKFWINGFIHPHHVEGPPGAGLVFDYEYFSGDDRGYSHDIHASSRIHAEVEIGGLNTGQPHITFQWLNCGASHALDANLTVVATETAHPQGGFHEPTVDGHLVHVQFAASASMPLLKASPDADANGWFTVDPFSGWVSFSGNIDTYPWWEAYVTVNNGSAHTLICEPPTGGPESLFGDANRHVSADTTIAVHA